MMFLTQQNHIKTLFPEFVYNKNHTKFDNSLFINKAEELRKQYDKKPKEKILHTGYGDTFNSKQDNYDVLSDESFSYFVNESTKEVLSFAKIFSKEITKITPLYGWLNVAKPGEYQEYHKHKNTHFTMVYYPQVNELTGSIVLMSHEYANDMYPIDNSVEYMTRRHYASFSPKIGDMVIFKSNLQHGVNKNMSDINRISVSICYIADTVC